jgi:hypothetical protein
MLRRLIVCLALLAAGSSFADAKDGALAADAADCVTTGAALAFGLSEVNPLGPVASCALKGIATAIADTQPEPARTQALHAQSSLYAGAAANNLMALAGAGSASPVFGVMLAVGLWASGQEEREFMRLCDVHRQLAHDNTLRCNYTPAP